MYFETVRNGRSRSSKVIDSVPIESAYATSYWSSIVTLKHRRTKDPNWS